MDPRAIMMVHMMVSRWVAEILHALKGHEWHRRSERSQGVAEVIVLLKFSEETEFI